MRILGLATTVIIISGLVGTLYLASTSGHLATIPLLSQLTSTTKKLIQSPAVDAPGPLRQFLESSRIGTLTRPGIIEQTNRQRQQNGNLAALKENAKLDQAAQKKVDDMFAKQYFEHVSPDGKGPSDLADSVGYSYIRIGENLALGNFKNDEDVVTAWMNSPGHRANILRPNVTEIGVAVGKGQFEGKTVWLAVQEFGLPASTCPTPDASLQKSFDTQQTQATAEAKTLDQQKLQLAGEQTALQNLANQIKQLIADGNALITQGNEQIQKGNEVYQQTGSKEQAQPYWDKGHELQAEGQAKHDQTDQLQAEFNTKQATFQKEQTTYNQQVDAYQTLSTKLKTMSEQLNTAIRVYNACIEK